MYVYIIEHESDSTIGLRGREGIGRAVRRRGEQVKVSVSSTSLDAVIAIALRENQVEGIEE